MCVAHCCAPLVVRNQKKSTKSSSCFVLVCQICFCMFSPPCLFILLFDMYYAVQFAVLNVLFHFPFCLCVIFPEYILLYSPNIYVLHSPFHMSYSTTYVCVSCTRNTPIRHGVQADVLCEALMQLFPEDSPHKAELLVLLAKLPSESKQASPCASDVHIAIVIIK